MKGALQQDEQFTLSCQVSASCPTACQCPPDVPVCAAGVALMLDSCGCCKVCARQLNEDCSRTRPCDSAKGLECNFGGGSDAAQGICRAKLDGRSCEFNSRIYQNGETFQTNCKYRCTCTDGYIRCASLCNRDLSMYEVGCAKWKKVKAKGKCCERLICLKDANTGRSKSAKVSQCKLQTTAWSPCSKSCGPGISSRMTNNNTECKLVTETQTCEIHSCKKTPNKGTPLTSPQNNSTI
uniref:CCN family member 1 n=1 Tax=Cyprinodon variegatus TaxID=28743 RepID=A0A3Q2DHQ5_CYPVA